MLEFHETKEDIEALYGFLDKLIGQHKKIKSSLPKKAQSREWAIWLLQGAALAITRDAVNDCARGNKLSALTHLRLMSEIVDNIVFFSKASSTNKELSESLEAWFEKFNHEKAKYRLLTSDKRGPLKIKTTNLKITIDYQKQFNHFLSQYAHASYALVDNLFRYSPNAHSLDFYSIEDTFTSNNVFWCSKVMSYAVLVMFIPYKIYDYSPTDVSSLGLLVHSFWPDTTTEDEDIL